MMKYILTYLCLFVIMSCRNDNAKTPLTTLNKETGFQLAKHYDKFKYHNIDKFEIDTFEFGSRDRHYQRVDTATLVQILRGSTEATLHESWYYYSTFQDSSYVTFLQESDEYGAGIWLVKFDEKGQFKYKTVLAISGGDAGDAWQAFSIYKNNNIFIKSSINSTWDIDADTLGYQDSLVFKLTLNKDTFQLDTVSVKVFGRVEDEY